MDEIEEGRIQGAQMKVYAVKCATFNGAHAYFPNQTEADSYLKDADRMFEGQCDGQHSVVLMVPEKDLAAALLQIERLTMERDSLAEQHRSVEKDYAALNRLLGEARKLLEKVEEQGLHHSCAMEGYTGPDCDECMEGLEQDILKFLRPTIEDLLGECRECNRLVRDCGNHGPIPPKTEKREVTGEIVGKIEPSAKFGPPQCTCMGFFKMNCAVHR